MSCFVIFIGVMEKATQKQASLGTVLYHCGIGIICVSCGSYCNTLW